MFHVKRSDITVACIECFALNAKKMEKGGGRGGEEGGLTLKGNRGSGNEEARLFGV